METIEKITIRCFVIGMVFVLIWFLLCIATGNAIYELHADWFKLNENQVRLINYCGLMFTKICVFVFFLIPYIACKWAGKKS
ncbi:MAG: DUF6868 family protein [Planctomycetota bacterium]|jgi:hypothetical protein